MGHSLSAGVQWKLSLQGAGSERHFKAMTSDNGVLDVPTLHQARLLVISLKPVRSSFCVNYKIPSILSLWEFFLNTNPSMPRRDSIQVKIEISAYLT